MEFFAVLGGVSAKIYDDITDNNISVNETLLESLKGLQWISLTALSLGDFNFVAIMYFFNIANWIGGPNGFTTPYELSLLIVYPMFFIYTFWTMANLTKPDIISIFFILLAGIGEPIMHKFIGYTEGSPEKLLQRFTSVIIFGAWVILKNELKISFFITKFLLYGIGYGIISCFFQYYLIQNGLSYEKQREYGELCNLQTKVISCKTL